MSVIVITAAAGSPGVTTTAAALAVHWPRPVVLIEADTAAASTLMPGFFRSNLRTTAGGIEKLAFAASRGLLQASDLIDPEWQLSIAVHELPPIDEAPIPALPQGHKLWVVPGFAQLDVADGVTRLWPQLPPMFDALDEAGIDVIIDLGTLRPDDERLDLVDIADLVVFIATRTMVDLNRTYRRFQLQDLVERTGLGVADRYRMVLVDPAPAVEAIPVADFRKHVLPVLDVLPFDPVGAATFSAGVPDKSPRRNKTRAAVKRLSGVIRSTLTDSANVRNAR